MRIWHFFTLILFCLGYKWNKLRSWVRGWDFIITSLALSLGRTEHWLGCQTKEQNSTSDPYSLALPRTHAVLSTTGCPILPLISVLKSQVDMCICLYLWDTCLYLWEGEAAGCWLFNSWLLKRVVLTWAFVPNPLWRLYITIHFILISCHVQKTYRFLSFTVTFTILKWDCIELFYVLFFL